MTFHSITKIGKFLEANLSEVPERPGKGDEAWNFFNVFFVVLDIFAWKSDKVLRYFFCISKRWSKHHIQTQTCMFYLCIILHSIIMKSTLSIEKTQGVGAVLC